MSRSKGTFNLSANLEVKKDAPLDSRSIVDAYEDLKVPSTWVDDDDIDWTYVGMLVVAKDKPGKVYQLIDKDYTQDASWKVIGDTDGLPTEQLSTIKSNQNDIVVVDSELMSFNADDESDANKANVVNVSMQVVSADGSNDSYRVDFPQASEETAGTMSAADYQKLASIGTMSNEDIDDAIEEAEDSSN